MGYFKNLLIEREDEEREASIPMAEEPETEVKDDGWDSFKREEQLRDETEEEEGK